MWFYLNVSNQYRSKVSVYETPILGLCISFSPVHKIRSYYSLSDSFHNKWKYCFFNVCLAFDNNEFSSVTLCTVVVYKTVLFVISQFKKQYIIALIDVLTKLLFLACINNKMESISGANFKPFTPNQDSDFNFLSKPYRNLF